MTTAILARNHLTGVEQAMRTFIDHLTSHALIKDNSWGVSLWAMNPRTGTYTAQHSFGHTKEGAEHDAAWYIENADGKARICAETGLDSLIVARTNPGLLPLTGNMFPWGGGVIDTRYGIIVGTSGFAELEDCYVSETGKGLVVVQMDMTGHRALEDARDRGKGDDPSDRMTRAA